MKSKTYEEFVEKFKPKKTTDDCYTPPLVYDAVASWVEQRYGVDRAHFVRPFFPGENYWLRDYTPEDIVVDNPPFSILSEIIKFYGRKGIRYFLFGPTLTLLSSSVRNATAIVTGNSVIYENGAAVNTSFLTNMEGDVALKSDPSLYRAVEDAVTETQKQRRKELPKYAYDLHVVTAPMVVPYSRLGIEFSIPRAEAVAVDALDEQRKSGKAIYGKGLLISDRLAEEREKAEREKAGREKAERWQLSARERRIVEMLNKAAGCPENE